MAKRRRAKTDPIEELVKFTFVGVFLLVFAISKSFQTALIAAILGLVASVVILMMLKLKRRERLKRSGIFDIDKMDGWEFEYYLGYLFQAYGYRTEVTRAAGDFGADLVISKGDKRIVVQAKRYASTVGIKAVQEVQAAIAHYKAVEGWVVSNSDYTEAAYTLAKSNRVRLINREQLIEMMLTLKSKTTGRPTTIKKPAPVSELCTFCGGEMIKRKTNRGDAYACSNYPNCTNVKMI